LPSNRITQRGISEGINVPRTHMTRVLRPLLQEGLIEEDKTHVTRKERKLKVYRITSLGVGRVKSMMEGIKEKVVMLAGPGVRRKARVEELLDHRPKIGYLGIWDAMDGGVLPFSTERLLFSDDHVELAEFHDREEELARAREFLSGTSGVLVVISNRGYGSSTLIKKIALELSNMPLLWHDLCSDGGGPGIWRRIDEMTSRFGEKNLEQLIEEGVMLCFDNYHLLPEEGVDALMTIAQRMKGGRSKMLVAMRGENPSYNRFYQRSDVQTGLVTEIKIGRLPERSAREMLGEDLDDEAMKLIYMLTKGQPLAMSLLKRGDEPGLTALFPKEEVRFLMYLRSKKR